MNILFKFSLFILCLLLFIACFISFFSGADMQTIINDNTLSLDKLLYNLSSLETPDFILTIQEWLANLQIPVPDVPVIRELTNFINGFLRFDVVVFNMILNLLDTLSKFITLLILYI